MSDVEPEANEADAAEQQFELVDDEGAALETIEETPDEANPADAAEQHRTVPLDEDDYRW
ncbi:hypothetical protein NGB36_06385 [Streptomyces sp. RB6PN25]|uniref:Uncharacterized protein n=1 Tax=Streptomyces humicola TaxID=2953240 RepID=A0ABT1PRD4_9ACTN|nr:hypothetical protein [Streptomyces humicola]MCQ4080232.1 hypothetical protein [Streptomyces humicola]